MKQLMSGKGPIFWLVIVLFLFIGISFLVTPTKPQEYPDFASDSPSPSGTKAFYTYLEHEKNHVGRWRQTPDFLPQDDSNQLLLMVEPSFISDKGVMDDYISFMESGNTILLLKVNPEGMFDVRTEPVESDDEDKTVTDSEGDVYQAERGSPFRIDSDDDDILLQDDLGTIATEKEFHDGALITAVTPEWISNDKITDEDHIELLFSMMDESDWDGIYFDEYMHEPDNVIAAYPGWILMAGFQVALLAILWLWYKGKRFGGIVVPREATVRFSDERIRALAAWHRRLRLYHDSFRMQADYLRILLQERWGIPYHKEWIDITTQLEKRDINMSQEDIQSIISGVTRVLTNKDMNKKEFLFWSERLDTLRKEVEKY